MSAPFGGNLVAFLALLSLALTSETGQGPARPRARELGLSIGGTGGTVREGVMGGARA